MVHTGSAYDPAGKAGLAMLTGQVLMGGGTVARPGVDLNRRFQDLGANIEGTVTDNALSISFSVLKENSGQALDAIKETLAAPELAAEKVDFVRTRARGAVAHRNDDPGVIAQREFAKLVFGEAYSAQPEYATVDRISRADMVTFHRRYFFPKNVVLSLSGDFDSAAMKSKLEGVFSDWTVEQPAAPEAPKVGGGGAAGKYFAIKKDAPQAYLCVGGLGGDFLDKDYAALHIAAEILGGGMRGRLYQRMHNMTEPLSVTWVPGAGHPGLFRIAGAVSPFVVTKVLQGVYDELNNLRTGEVSDAELKAAKEAAVNSYAFAFEDQLSIMPRLAQYAFYGLPQDYILQHQRELAAVTRADILRVAKARLDPAQMTTVVVGNPTGFESPLDSLGGTITPIDLTIPAARLEAETGDANSQGLGKRLLLRAQQALGGTDKLAALTDYVQEMVYKFDASAGGAEVPSTERWVAPGFLRQDNSLPAGKASVYCDGKAGWVSNGTNSTLLSGVQLQQMQSDVFRVFFPLLLSDRAAGRKVNALDENMVEISDSDGHLAKVVLDANGLVKNVQYEAVTVDGQLSVIDTYSDYRDVNGIKVPHQVDILVGGKKFQTIHVTNVRLNTGLKIQDLERRP
jgi:zinc protease